MILAFQALLKELKKLIIGREFGMFYLCNCTCGSPKCDIILPFQEAKTISEMLANLTVEEVEKMETDLKVWIGQCTRYRHRYQYAAAVPT